MVKHHYLVLTWPEDPDDPTFNSQLDWDISHPPECNYDHESYCWGCAIGYDMNMHGVEAFGGPAAREEHYSLVPTTIPIEFYAEKFSTLNGTEWDVGIRLVDGPE